MSVYQKRGLPKTWQDGTYQQAIRSARRRLAGKEHGEIGLLEAKILSDNLLTQSKPDYSRWMYDDLMEGRRHGRASKRSVPSIAGAFTKLSSSDNKPKHDVVSLVPHQFNIQKLEALPDIGEISYHGPRASAVEFLSVVDQAPVHESPVPRRRPLNISTSYEHFGLCMGCFHRKGPHHHYQTPIRIGGGYSIYHRDPVPWADVPESETRLNTIKWLAGFGKVTGRSKPSLKGFNDDYSVGLFEQFIANGGEAAALKEYLDSNFSQDVLDDLRESGVNVQMILEYTELYRSHIKSLLEENIQEQSKLVEEHTQTLDFAVMYASIQGEGVEMRMLLALLKRGRMDDEVVKFENEGGNIEILEHFAQQINEDPSRDSIVAEFERLLHRSDQHETAQIFLNFLKSGGEVTTLKKCLERTSDTLEEVLSSLNGKQVELLKLCLSKFADHKTFTEKLRIFLERHLHLYQGAELLQFFMESGGRIKTLKEFIKSDCNILVVNEDESESNVNVELLKKVGQQFVEDSALRKILEEFPEEPQVIEVYIQSGGDFSFLVKAIADTSEAPKLEDYVKQQSEETFRKMSDMANLVISKPEIRVSVSKRQEESEGELPTLLLPTIIEKAKADLLYDELMETENSFIVNEGASLAKTMDFQGLIMTPVSAINVAERQQVTRVYRSLVSSNPSSSVTSVTGKKRKKLWTAPKPFEIKESIHSPTQPQSPFSQHRVFQISSLTEDHIMDAAKEQRRQLDALRRNFHIEDFQKNWKISITSPRGSIVSGTCDSEREQPSHSLLDKVIAELPREMEAKPAPAPSVDRKSRKKQQREKMREMKRGSNGGRTSPGRRSNTSSPGSFLSVPTMDQSQGIQEIPPPSDENSSPPIEEPADPFSNEAVEDQDNFLVNENQKDLPNTEDKEEHIDSEVNRSVHYGKKLPIPQISGAVVKIVPPQDASEQNFSPRFATAFGPKAMSSSYSSFLSANTMMRMRDNPETMIGVEPMDKLTSKSDSNIAEGGYLFANSRMQNKMRNKRIKNRRAMRTFSSDFMGSNRDGEDDTVEEHPEEDLVDLLKQYCIIREHRLHVYRRLFDKYLLIKSMRDREKALENERLSRHANTEKDFNNLFKANSLEGEIEKTDYILKKLTENIEEIQQQIVVMKDEVNRSIASVALRKYGDSLSLVTEGQNRRTSVFGKDGPNSYRETSILRRLSVNMRLQCEADAKVRNRKVALVHLRDKARNLIQRRKTLRDSFKRLLKRMEHERLEEGFSKREKHKFTRKQSFIYRELHPEDNDVIEMCDMREALNDLDSSLSYFDPTQLIEEIVKGGGVTFQVFCVVAALHEAKNLQQPEVSTLTGKINVCKDYYRNLLGPDLDVLRLELEAAGITEKQRNAIIKKLTRGNAGQLDFLDFVTYVPLFLDIHSKILTNPLSS